MQNIPCPKIIKMKNLRNKIIPLFLAFSLASCSGLPIQKMSLDRKIDGIFSQKAKPSKAQGIEVYAAKLANKKEYGRRGKGMLKYWNSPVAETTFGWEIFKEDSQGRHRLTNNTVMEYNPQISPDAKLIVYEKHDEKNLNSDIFTMDTDGDNIKRLTKFGDCEKPVFSPDGAAIAYMRKGAIWIVDREGKETKEIFTPKYGGVRISEWTEEGLILHYNDSIGPNAIIDFEKGEIRKYNMFEKR